MTWEGAGLPIESVLGPMDAEVFASFDDVAVASLNELDFGDRAADYFFAFESERSLGVSTLDVDGRRSGHAADEVGSPEFEVVLEFLSRGVSPGRPVDPEAEPSAEGSRPVVTEEAADDQLGAVDAEQFVADQPFQFVADQPFAFTDGIRVGLGRR
jgi:hypothetical protein